MEVAAAGPTEIMVGPQYAPVWGPTGKLKDKYHRLRYSFIVTDMEWRLRRPGDTGREYDEFDVLRPPQAKVHHLVLCPPNQHSVVGCARIIEADSLDAMMLGNTFRYVNGHIMAECERIAAANRGQCVEISRLIVNRRYLQSLPNYSREQSRIRYTLYRELTKWCDEHRKKFVFIVTTREQQADLRRKGFMFCLEELYWSEQYYIAVIDVEASRQVASPHNPWFGFSPT